MAAAVGAHNEVPGHRVQQQEVGLSQKELVYTIVQIAGLALASFGLGFTLGVALTISPHMSPERIYKIKAILISDALMTAFGIAISYIAVLKLKELHADLKD